MNPPGPRPQPMRCLREAAILYAEAVEAEADYAEMHRAWDRLRMSAIRYRDAPKAKGRPKRDQE